MTKEIGKLSLETLQLLTDIGAMGTTELARITGRSNTSINDNIRRLKRRGLVRIVKWDRQPAGCKGEMIPMYGAGGGEDAPKPAAKSDYQRNRDYRVRKRKIISIRRNSFKDIGIWRGLL